MSRQHGRPRDDVGYHLVPALRAGIFEHVSMDQKVACSRHAGFALQAEAPTRVRGFGRDTRLDTF